MAAAISFPAKVKQKTKRRERKKSLERISTRNVVEISGVLPENEIKNEIKNIYCFLKMGGKKNPIPAGFKARAERADDREPWGGCVWDRGVLKGPLRAPSGLSGASRDGMTPGKADFHRNSHPPSLDSPSQSVGRARPGVFRMDVI